MPCAVRDTLKSGYFASNFISLGISSHMRYCLSCHYFSANGPICTHCGRSFGGRLCNHKKRHLNPPDAQFCGQCGSTTLTEAASSIPLGCSGRGALLALTICLIWWGGSHFSQWGYTSFLAVTGYRSPLVWAIEKTADLLIILFVFYFLSMFMPGAAGNQFRALLSKLCLQFIKSLFHLLGALLSVLGKVVWRMIEGEKPKNESAKR